MKSLESVFDQRRASDYNAQLVGNLTVISDELDRRALKFDSGAAERARSWEVRSSAEGSDTITVDRDAEALAEYHELSVAQLTDFAEGGRVLDVGSGKSPLLDEFLDVASETVAVDLNKGFARHQRERGHRAITTPAERLFPIQSGSVRLLHASFSAPYWTPTPAKAARVASEYMRVLEPGGIALVGPVSTVNEHQQHEFFLERRRVGLNDVLPWPEHDDGAYLTYVKNAFVRTVLDNPAASITGTRMLFEDDAMLRMRMMTHQRIHIPNFLMLRRED
jgi:SAM-dependent methyltransferase